MNKAHFIDQGVWNHLVLEVPWIIKMNEIVYPHMAVHRDISKRSPVLLKFNKNFT